MNQAEFEAFLTVVTATLTRDVQENPAYHVPSVFETRVRSVIRELAENNGLHVDMSPQAQAFPDIVLGEYGIEVKVANKDVWRSVANSVFEGSRDANVQHIYILFGKMGGVPSVAWGRYEDCVVHVRTSHVPRFEVQIQATAEYAKLK